MTDTLNAGRLGAIGGLYAKVRGMLPEILRFGAVGGAAFITDVAVFNLVRNIGPELMADKPLTAKVISVIAATIVAWWGNRTFTYGDRDSGLSKWQEFRNFALINVIGLGIGLLCLVISHYGLNLRSQLADNISANGVGLILGMIFRFVAYRTWLFPKNDVADEDLPERIEPEPVSDVVAAEPELTLVAVDTAGLPRIEGRRDAA